MAYEKQTWETGDTITAAKLNHMEDGIASTDAYDLVLVETVDSLSESRTLEGHGLSFAEILAKIENGESVSMLYTFSGYGSLETSVGIRCAISVFEDPADKQIVITGNTAGNIIDIVTYFQSEPSSVQICLANTYNFTYDSSTKEYTFALAENVGG